MSENNEKDKKTMDESSSKPAFKLSLVGGIIAILAIAAFFLLGTMIGKNTKTKVYKNTEATTLSNNRPSAPTAVTPPSVSAEINIVPVNKESDWIKGDVNAKVSIIEFSDTECPFCVRFHKTMQEVIDDYDGEINWVYRHFPISQLHAKATKEAEASECAGDQGGNDAFWAYMDRLMAITPANDGLLLSQLPEIAEYVGLNVNKFQECLDSGKFSQKVQDQIQQAKAAGAQGTPYSVIVSGDKKVVIPGALPVAGVKALIDPLLQ